MRRKKFKASMALLAGTDETAETAELAQKAAPDVRRGIMQIARLMAAGVPRGELSQAKLSALATLARYGSMSVGGLSRMMTIRPQSMTRVLAHLEEAGLSSRERAAEDAREQVVSITPLGVQLVRQEGLRRDILMSDAMRRALTSMEIEILAIAGRLLEKMAEQWIVEPLPDLPELTRRD